MSQILLIEDEDLLQEIMSHALSQHGHEILLASDGVAGLEVARAHKPDLIISDMNMPKMTGWEVIKTVRADPDLSATPFIALTAHATTGDRDTGYASGADDYMEKPVDMAKLMEKIERLLAD